MCGGVYALILESPAMVFGLLHAVQSRYGLFWVGEVHACKFNNYRQVNFLFMYDEA